MTRPHRPIVVVGAGVAGMATALAAAPAPVRLLCRGEAGGGSASALAQGGIAAALGADDSMQAHAADTLQAGARHNDAAAVHWLTSAAPRTIAWLQTQGVAFDRAPDGALLLGREGGHDAARIVHAGGDATGAELVRALRARVEACAHIQWRCGVEVDALLLAGDRVVGVRMRDAHGCEESVEAAAVVLATGGIGALYPVTSNPPGADGAGLALALAAGAATRDLEFVQFHPTALDAGGQHVPLLTEALRGAGARLVDGDGAPLMRGLHPLGDLAPRDVVARRVWQVRHAGGAALLDATAIEGDWNVRFPTVLAACRAHGFDPCTDRLPVTAAAHFHMGGIATDLDGRSSVPGLYAVGEVACNGVHGANRLASNSLLEGVACGRRLGARLATLATVPAAGSRRCVERGVALPSAELPALRERLWRAIGPVREGGALREAWRSCAAASDRGWQARLAFHLIDAALRREGSLGAHFRSDAAMADRPTAPCA